MGNIMNKMKDSIIGWWKKELISKREVSTVRLKWQEKYEKQCRRIKRRDEIVAAEMKEEEEEQLILLSLESLQGDDDDDDQKKNLPNLNLKLVAKLRTLIKEDLDILEGALEFKFRFTEQECSNSDICSLIPALHLYFAVTRDIQEHNISSCQSSTISQLLPYPLLPELQAWIHSPENRLQNTKRRIKLWRIAIRLYTEFYNNPLRDSSISIIPY